MLFCTLYGEVGLKGYAEITCKITFSEIEEKMSVQKDLVVTLQFAQKKLHDIHTTLL